MILSLKNKITLSVLIVIFFFGSLATIFVFTTVRNAFFEQEKDHIKYLVSHQTEGLNRVFLYSRDLAKNIAGLHEIKEYIKNNSFFYDERITQLLHDYNIGNMYSAIYLLDKKGTTLVSTEPSFVAKNYSFRDYFKKTILGRSATDMAIGATSKKLGYYFSEPVLNDENIVIGVIVVKLKPEFVHGFIEKHVESFSTGNVKPEIMLVDEYGVIIFSEEKDKLYKSLGKLSLDKEDFETLERRFPGFDIEPLGYQTVYDELDTIDKIKIFDIHDEDGELLAIDKVSGFDYFVFLELSTREIMEKTFNIALLLSAFVLFAAFFAFFVIYAFVSRILRPVHELKNVAIDIAKGNLSRRVSIKTQDEISEVANAFNKMADKLIKEKINIEKKVKDRTLELEKMNKYMTGRELKMIELKKEIKKAKKENENKK